MASSFERSGPVMGGLLILASLALGAGSARWEPDVNGADAGSTTPTDAGPLVDESAAGPDAGLVARPTTDAVPMVEPERASRPDRVTHGDDSLDPPTEPLLVMEGGASWYSDALAGRRTASGERYDPTELIAAHRALPFGTTLRVTNLANERSVVVRVVDRGPFVSGRVIDLSRSAAQTIGMIRTGHARVRIEVLDYGD